MIAAVAAFAFVMQELLGNDGSNESLTLKSFYLEEPDSLDVVVMGASEVMFDYAAPEVYRTSGYTSFPYAFTINSAPLWKYELKEIERTQDPQLLIVETNGSLYKDDKYIHAAHCVQVLGDNMPLSENKLKFAREMSDNTMETIFPLIKYHYKWDEILSGPVKDRVMVYRDGHSRLRAAQTYLYQTEFSTDYLYPADDLVSDMNKDGEAALREFLEVCKESDIPKIIFVEFPHVLNEEGPYLRHQRVNAAAQIVREAGFDYIDFNLVADEIGLDPAVDFYDPHHMLASGQEKFSKYLGEYIKENYNIEPREQSEKNRLEWDDSVELIDKYYQAYRDIRAEHADAPHDEIDYNLVNERRTMDILSKY